jgi:hypothetical protein
MGVAKLIDSCKKPRRVQRSIFIEGRLAGWVVLFNRSRTPRDLRGRAWHGVFVPVKVNRHSPALKPILTCALVVDPAVFVELSEVRLLALVNLSAGVSAPVGRRTQQIRNSQILMKNFFLTSAGR